MSLSICFTHGHMIDSKHNELVIERTLSPSMWWFARFSSCWCSRNVRTHASTVIVKIFYCVIFIEEGTLHNEDNIFNFQIVLFHTFLILNAKLAYSYVYFFTFNVQHFIIYKMFCVNNVGIELTCIEVTCIQKMCSVPMMLCYLDRSKLHSIHESVK